MTDVNTKIEIVTEAIEALVLATVIATQNTSSAHQREINHQNVLDARAIVSKSLRTLLTPTLRVVNGTPPRIDLPENVPYGGKGIEGMNLG